MSPPTEGFSDTAFKENLSRPVHSWVPWIGGFSGAFVEDSLKRFTQGGCTVLDPFCGVGTTLVESARMGCESVGIELNPFAALAARVKSNAHALSVDELNCRLLALSGNWKSRSAERLYPAEFGTREPFFSNENLCQVNKLLNWLDELPNDLETDMLRVAVGSMIVSVSNYSYEPSLSTRSKAGRPTLGIQDVLHAFSVRVQSMMFDVDLIKAESKWASSTVHVANSMNMSRLLKPSSVDLIITSPPYLNNYHYVRNSRPHLFLLGLISSRTALIDLQESNFGKYWQTVRNRPLPEITAKCSTVGTIVEELKDAKHSGKQLYNGTGWAAYTITYFNDSKLCLSNCFKVVKRGSKAVFVLGDSYLHGVYIPVHEVFGCIAEEVGFKVELIDKVRLRNGGSTVRSRKAINSSGEHLSLSEYVIVLSKPSA